MLASATTSQPENLHVFTLVCALSKQRANDRAQISICMRQFQERTTWMPGKCPLKWCLTLTLKGILLCLQHLLQCKKPSLCLLCSQKLQSSWNHYRTEGDDLGHLFKRKLLCAIFEAFMGILTRSAISPASRDRYHITHTCIVTHC